MAPTAPARRPMTLPEFLAWEEAQDERWEFIAGQVRMMAGGSVAHNLIAGNLFALLKAALATKAGSCRAFTDGMRLIVPSGDAVYPDAMVVCGEVALTDRQVENPVVIVEVVSPATEAHDRGAKWLAYQSIPALRHYILIAQDRVGVEAYSRAADRPWRYELLTGIDTSLRLDGIDISVPLAAIYDGAIATGAA